MIFDTILTIDNRLRKNQQKIGNIGDISLLDRYIVEILGMWYTYALV